MKKYNYHLLTSNNSNALKLIKLSVTRLNVFKNNKFVYRTMMQGRSVHLARAGYHCLAAITNNNVLDNTHRNNPIPFCDALVSLSLDHTTGALHHKGSYLRHMINKRLDSHIYYRIMNERQGHTTIHCMDGTTDMRFFNEMPTFDILMSTMGPSRIARLECFSDNPNGLTFHKNIQANPDGIATVVAPSVWNNLATSFIPRAVDEKSGNAVFKHATRGYIGAITYEHVGCSYNNVQTLNNVISLDRLLEIDSENLRSILAGLRQDNIYDPIIHDPLLKKAYQMLHPEKSIKASWTDENRLKIHENFQKFIWDNFQADPSYTRNISLSLPVIVKYDHFMEKDSAYLRFCHDCSENLPNKILDLNSFTDNRQVFISVLTSYKKNIDSLIVPKLFELQEKGGIDLNEKFINTLKIVEKTCTVFL